MDSLVNDLLKHIDQPFFLNQQSYIDSWISLYNENKNINLLLFFYHKKVGTFFHWIYLELSSYYEEQGRIDICYYLMRKALKRKVYDIKLINRNLEALINNYGQIIVDEISVLSVLNLKSLFLFDREWIYKEPVLSTPKEIYYNADGECLSALEIRYHEFVANKNIDLPNDLALTVKNNEQFEFMEGLQTDMLLKDDKVSIAEDTAHIDSKDCQYNEGDRDILVDNDETTLTNNGESKMIFEIKGDFIEQSFIEINHFIYCLGDKINSYTWKLARIGKVGNELVTVASKDLCIQLVDDFSESEVNPRAVLFCKRHDQLFKIFENFNFINAENLFSILSGCDYGIDEDFIVFFYFKIYKTLLLCKNKNINLQKLSLEDILVDNKFQTHVTKSSHTESIQFLNNFDILHQILKQTKLYVYGYYNEIITIEEKVLLKIEDTVNKINIEKLLEEKMILLMENGVFG